MRLEAGVDVVELSLLAQQRTQRHTQEDGLLAAEVPVQTEASEVKSLSRRAKCRCTPVLAPADIVATSTSVPGEGCVEDRVVSD